LANVEVSLSLTQAPHFWFTAGRRPQAIRRSDEPGKSRYRYLSTLQNFALVIARQLIKQRSEDRVSPAKASFVWMVAVTQGAGNIVGLAHDMVFFFQIAMLSVFPLPTPAER
jgi:hypothetical protein